MYLQENLYNSPVNLYSLIKYYVLCSILGPLTYLIRCFSRLFLLINPLLVECRTLTYQIVFFKFDLISLFKKILSSFAHLKTRDLLISMKTHNFITFLSFPFYNHLNTCMFKLYTVFCIFQLLFDLLLRGVYTFCPSYQKIFSGMFNHYSF